MRSEFIYYISPEFPIQNFHGQASDILYNPNITIAVMNSIFCLPK